jgi:CCR4-NOT transcription complex subunit 1
MREYVTEESLIAKPNCEPYQCFYYAILKLILVIIHDFSDFLSEFSLQLALLVAPKFYQLANIIISAYPK